jgi:outer membrane lipoprotein SlyB
MIRLIACFIALAAFDASAQATPGSPGAPLKPEIVKKQTCAECGEIRSIRRVERKGRAADPTRDLQDKNPSGLVASIPLGGGGKPTVGSSTREEKRREAPLVIYEVIVQLDDGRVRIVTQDDGEDLRAGDKVRVEDNKVILR